MNTEQIIKWINEGQLWKFYKSKEWRNLRPKILIEQNYECQYCKTMGIITKAVTVHHVQEVRKHPELALSRYYYDENGSKQRQLVSICKACHNKEHDRIFEKKVPLNIERW
jgi:5-methylcytosine-specific restriction endonuclease McrA